MADIQKVNLNGTLYDINDPTARTNANPDDGSIGDVLINNGSTNAWVDQSELSVGSATSTTKILNTNIEFKSLIIGTTTYQFACGTL